jgi:2-C-methyl-D-erythritol 4-phosphate cytidylyltransferase
MASTEGNSMACAILLAGGTGERFGLDMFKQLAPLAGRSILERTLSTFVDSELFHAIIVAAHPSAINEISEIASRFSGVPITVVAGGANRNASTLAALQQILHIPGEAVLVHDAVRPLVDTHLLAECLARLEVYEAVDVGVELSDTVIELDDRGCIATIPQRSRLRSGQTPQGFRIGLLHQALTAIDEDGLAAFTDNCGAYLAFFPDARIFVVQGSHTNIKITNELDLVLSEQLILMGLSPAEFSRAKPQTDSLKGQHAVIVGGTSGLGAATVESLREAGYVVTAFSTRTGVDVRDEAAVREAFLEANNRNGPISCVANFAGILEVGEFSNAASEVVRKSVEVNVIGAMTVAREAHPYLTQTGGDLILVGSSSFTRGRAGSALYSSTKAATINLAQALAEEWASQGVRVNALVPRRASTPMRFKAFPTEDESTLLSPPAVGAAVVATLRSGTTGSVVWIR